MQVFCHFFEFLFFFEGMSIAIRHALRRPINALYALFLISRARHRTCMSAPVCTFSSPQKREARCLSFFSHDLCGVVLGVHLVDDAFQYAVLVEDEGLAERTHRHLAVVSFLSPCAEGL